MTAPSPSPTLRTISRRNVSRQVADIMRDMILVGDLKPGQLVRHEEMSARLGVSTMPVREALLRLSHEGFIEAPQNRSFRVVSTSREDIKDVYWAHAILAGELAARACVNEGRRVADELDAINERWAVLPAKTAPEQYEALNWELHRSINLAARSPKLILLLRHTIRFIPERFYTLLPEWHEHSMTGHCEIATALRTNDPEKVRAAAANHVRDAGILLIGYFTKTGYWEQPKPATRASRR